MKKIGIFTLNGNFNYGNRLQAYALQQVIQRLGGTSEVIVSVPPAESIKKPLKHLIAKLPISNPRFAYWRMLVKKEKIFAPFSKKYIHSHSVSGDIKAILPNYDLFIVGSDQVWNPYLLKNNAVNLLDFVPSEKKVSYAASFGVSHIPEEMSGVYRKSLKDFSRISVREEDGRVIIETLTGRKDVKVVPDPTLLLTRDTWTELSMESKTQTATKNKYVLVYTLRELSAMNKMRIQQYAQRHGYEICQIMGDLYDKSYTIPDPGEFIQLIADAEAIFTDSFHCCVFSIIYHRPFIAFDRTDGQKTSSRITTLLERFNLSQAKYSDGIDLDVTLKSEDFSDTEDILSDCRTEGLKFLQGTLERD